MQANDASGRAPVVLLSRERTTVLTYPAHLGSIDLRWRSVAVLPVTVTVVWTVFYTSSAAR